MLVFISGSINSGKTTTSKLLAQKLGAVFINVDDLNDQIPNFNLATDLDKSMDLAITEINKYLAEGKDVVANYVIRERDWQRFPKEIKTSNIYVITLAPRLEVAQSKRGGRPLSDWEMARIKYHYDTGVASPNFGHIIDNSDITLEETVDKILEIIPVRVKKRKLPSIIKEVGFDFSWNERNVWALNIPAEDIPIDELTWHFDIPFWSKPGGFYDLYPKDVMAYPKQYPEEYKRTMNADTSHPIDIMLWKGRYVILDGLHRLVKQAIEGKKLVRVRKIPQDNIPEILH